MPVAFDPTVFYTQYTKIADFILIWTLLTILIKWIFVRIKYATKAKHGLGGFFMGALGAEDKKTLFSLEGGMSCIIALMMTVAGMTYQNWSLKAVFTGDTFPIVMSIIVGALGYNAASARTKNNLVKLSTALILGGIAFGFLSYKTRAGADWQWWFFWFPLFILIIMSLTGEVKGARGGPGGRRSPAETIRQTSGDTKEATKKLAKVQSDFADLTKKTQEAEKKHVGVIQSLQNSLKAMSEALSIQIKEAQTFSVMLSAALAIATGMFAQGASADQVRIKLRQQFNDQITEAAITTVAPPQLPKEGAPAASEAPPAAPPKPEEVHLPPAVSQKVARPVQEAVTKTQVTHQELEDQIHRFEELAADLNKIPTDLRLAEDNGRIVQEELEFFAMAVAELAQQTKKDMPQVSANAEQLHKDAADAVSKADLQNKQLKTATEPLNQILASDSTQLQRAAAEIHAKLREVDPVLDVVLKNARRATASARGSITQADVNLYAASCTKLQQLLNDIAQSLEHHGDPLKTILVSLPGNAEAVRNAQQVFEDLQKQLPQLEARYAKLNQDIENIRSAKIEEEKAEQAKLLDVQNINDAVKKIDQTIIANFYHTVLPMAQGAGSSLFIPIEKGDVQVLQEEAQQVINALKELDDERVKVIDMATGNTELNLLAQTLADLQGLSLRKDLADFVKNKALGGMADNAKGDSRLGRALAQIFMGVLTRTPEEKLQKILEDVKAAASMIPKGAVRPA